MRTGVLDRLVMLLGKLTNNIQIQTNKIFNLYFKKKYLYKIRIIATQPSAFSTILALTTNPSLCSHSPNALTM